jgi:hypothetical protein
VLANGSEEVQRHRTVADCIFLYQSSDRTQHCCTHPHRPRSIPKVAASLIFLQCFFWAILYDGSRRVQKSISQEWMLRIQLDVVFQIGFKVGPAFSAIKLSRRTEMRDIGIFERSTLVRC